MPSDYNYITVNNCKIPASDVSDTNIWLAAIPDEDLARSFQELSISFLSREHIVFKSSGTTGIPKELLFPHDDIVASALKTSSFFQYNKDDKVLHVLPLRYVAGAMMLFRAWVSRLHLIVQDPRLAVTVNDFFQFAPMTPAQLSQSIRQQDDFLSHFNTILLGGGPVPYSLEERLSSSETTIYHGYGMTETLTHVALRKLGAGDVYKALDGVCFNQDTIGCLIVHIPHLSVSTHHTRDVVDLIDSGSFRWLGRADDVINSGGLKLYPQEIENALHPYISEPFVVVSQADELLGERIVLAVEGDEYPIKQQMFWELIEKKLRPKDIYFIPKFPRTVSGKIKRAEIQNQLT